jgi:hypothetical protein
MRGTGGDGGATVRGLTRARYKSIKAVTAYLTPT